MIIDQLAEPPILSSTHRMTMIAITLYGQCCQRHVVGQPSTVTDRYTLRLKKVPTFKLFVTLSNLNRFSNFYTAGKHIKFATRNLYSFPPHLDYIATLPCEVKSPNLLKLQKIQLKNRTVCDKNETLRHIAKRILMLSHQLLMCL